MGDPRKHRSKFSTPRKTWEKERIDEESELYKEYYFKNKSELWKLDSKLRNFARQAKKLIPLKTEQSEKEKKQLLTKLRSLNLISETGDFDDVLGITIKDLLDRRLQSLVLKNGLAKTMKQARQFIVHEHILVDNKKITSPNFLVPKAKEQSISFSEGSALADEMHPERKQKEKLAKKPLEKKGKKKEKNKDTKKSKEEKTKKEVKSVKKVKAAKKEKVSKKENKE